MSIPVTTPDPSVTITKTATFSTSTSPLTVDYKVVVTNAKDAGPVHKGLLTDTLYSPSGKVVANRVWDLDTVAPGDQIILTYTVVFPATAVPGTYRNTAVVSGFQNTSALTIPMKGIEVSKDIVIGSSGGLVLGAATTTEDAELTVSDENIERSSGICFALITKHLYRGSREAEEIKKLQMFLNAEVGAGLPVIGVFGPLTTAAVNTFQMKYKQEILTPLGLKGPTGGVYDSTIRKINEIACDGSLPSITSLTTPADGTTTDGGQVWTPTPTPVATTQSTSKNQKKTEDTNPGGTFLSTFGGLFSKLVPWF